jgi:hypothetical protein
MFEFIIGFATGLVIGWNLIPQPAWVKSLWSKVTGA